MNMSQANPVNNNAAQAHVLLVDDDVSVLDISTFILQQNGYAVSMASNGRDALGMLNGSANGARPVDLVITDLNMPEMSGVDFIQEMRKRAFAMPVVMATGCLESYSEPEIKNIGAERILLKPFKPAHLTDCVKNILARPSSSREGGKPADAGGASPAAEAGGGGAMARTVGNVLMN